MQGKNEKTKKKLAKKELKIANKRQGKLLGISLTEVHISCVSRLSTEHVNDINNIARNVAQEMMCKNVSRAGRGGIRKNTTQKCIVKNTPLGGK